MSKALYWTLIPKEPKEHGIDSLKHILREKYGYDLDETVGKELIPFLEGIAAASNSGTGFAAQELINAIQKHENVQIFTHG